MEKNAIGIIVSGGPAPGINGVISASVIEAYNRGVPVKGFKNGFRSVCEEGRAAIKELTLENTHAIHNKGGSILGTSRFNPLSTPENFERFKNTLAEESIDKLIVIGGEGSAWVSLQLSEILPSLRVVHVPKTIDNDLILPNKHPSFGFETARYVGTNILNTLVTDARTCERWFLVTSMGRNAGFLALGLGIASGASLTLIPEEYADQRPKPEEIAEVVFQCMKKRMKLGKNYGVAILAEGLLDKLDSSNSEALANCPRDELGRIRYSMLELGDVILQPLRKMVKDAGLEVKINTKNIGYELRCHDPVSFDIEYTTFLGYGAVEFLMSGHSGVMITRDFDQLGCIPLRKMVNEDGLVQSRTVDMSSDLYRVARSFMIR